MSSFHPFSARGGLKYAEAYHTGKPMVDSARRSILEALDTLLDSRLTSGNPKQELELFEAFYTLLSDYFAQGESWAIENRADTVVDRVERHRAILSELQWRILSFAHDRCTFSDVFSYIGFEIVIRYFGEEIRECEKAS